jgi:hypothetical protein
MPEILSSVAEICRDGLAIAQSCCLHDIVVLNDGSTTYHGAAMNTDSSIDMTLVKEDHCHCFCWRVGTDSWGSDHFPILVELNATFEPNLKRINNRRLY